MRGFVCKRGYTVQQDRLRKRMRRVHPEGVLAKRVLNRRHYRVGGPQCLWHIDENNKILRLALRLLLIYFLPTENSLLNYCLISMVDPMLVKIN